MVEVGFRIRDMSWAAQHCVCVSFLHGTYMFFDKYMVKITSITFPWGILCSSIPAYVLSSRVLSENRRDVHQQESPRLALDHLGRDYI